MASSHHLSAFQAQAFGRRRLPPRETAAVLDRLDAGCAVCRARLAPWLLPWFDPSPAAEARETDPRRCDASLAAEYRRAARRAAAAAVRQRAEAAAFAADRHLQRVLHRLEAEGPAALGRLPRALLGRPAVAALLLQIERRGTEHPRLRLRLAELAWDLASRLQRPLGLLPPLALRAGIELANAYRVRRHLTAAQSWLDAMRDHLAQLPEAEPRTAARWEEIQAAQHFHRARPAAALRALVRATALSRDACDAKTLTRSLLSQGRACDAKDGFRTSFIATTDAFNLSDPDHDPFGYRIGGLTLVMTLAGQRNWDRASALAARLRRQLDALVHGQMAVFRWKTDARLHRQAGRLAESLQACAAARQECIVLGDRMGEAMVLLLQAAAVEERGDLEQADCWVRQAADLLVAATDPSREVRVAADLLCIRGRFSSLRETLPLDHVEHFLMHAQTDPDVELISFLGRHA